MQNQTMHLIKTPDVVFRLIDERIQYYTELKFCVKRDTKKFLILTAKVEVLQNLRTDLHIQDFKAKGFTL